MNEQLERAIEDVASRLGIPAAWLRAVIEFETGGSFSPSARNPSSGATGLIQFMPATAAALGTSTAALAQMSGPAQMEYVYRYLVPYAGRFGSLEDVYMAVLWPRAIGQPDDYVLFAAGSLAYSQNKGLDWDGDGRITKADAARRVVAIAARSGGGGFAEPVTLAAGVAKKKEWWQTDTILIASALVGSFAVLSILLDD